MTQVESTAATTGQRVRWCPVSRRAPDRSWAFTAVWLVFLGYLGRLAGALGRERGARRRGASC
ncbi:MAG: hypothetical protein PGN29_17010 [Gordonia paraffinivorans]